ncbi:sigma-70 family RNA polymerase sigma factor [Psychrobacillus sp. L3]|uniref:sigma-70 family RNA polymerase sigma factor n=1 Tax=Psychrobacillus sp. L3 TaxID=3236891 RepID=UPI0036F43213
MKKTRHDELEAVYLAFAKPLYFYLLKLTGSDIMAEELVQETFYRATLSLDLYEGGQVKSWLFKVARNAYMDEWRKKKRWGWVPFYNHLSNSTDFISPYGVPEDELFVKEVADEVKDILELLPENYRTILYLREYEQFTYEELAGTLDISLDQVKVNLYRARQRFKLLVERLGKDFERGDRYDVE